MPRPCNGRAQRQPGARPAKPGTMSQYAPFQPDVRDRRQTSSDRHTSYAHHHFMPPPRGRGITNAIKVALIPKHAKIGLGWKDRQNFTFLRLTPRRPPNSVPPGGHLTGLPSLSLTITLMVNTGCTLRDGRLASSMLTSHQPDTIMLLFCPQILLDLRNISKYESSSVDS